MLAGRQRPQRFTSLNAILSVRQSAKRLGCEARHALGLAFAVARQADDFLGDNFRHGIGFVSDVEQLAGAVVRKLHELKRLRVEGCTRGHVVFVNLQHCHRVAGSSPPNASNQSCAPLRACASGRAAVSTNMSKRRGTAHRTGCQSRARRTKTRSVRRRWSPPAHLLWPIGKVPTRCAHIWLNPHGSKRDGISMKSLPARILRDSASSKPILTATDLLCRWPNFSVANSNSLSPVPMMTI